MLYLPFDYPHLSAAEWCLTQLNVFLHLVVEEHIFICYTLVHWSFLDFSAFAAFLHSCICGVCNFTFSHFMHVESCFYLDSS